MAKVVMTHFGMNLYAEGSADYCARQTDAFFGHARWEQLQDDKNDLEEIERQERADTAKEDGDHAEEKMQAVAPGVEWDVVAIYDNAGIPSIMHRFKRMTNAELFGGSDKVHPAFIIGGEVYDEIYISVYQNTMIDGKPYSLPYVTPKTEISMEDFAQACFSKGEGWHCLTAAEWGLIANISKNMGTLPHGNTACRAWHGDVNEKGVPSAEGRGITLTGTGPVTWTHDHTVTGVHDLCGNILEFCRGCRIVDGKIQTAENNDAALPETDLAEAGKDWHAVISDDGKPISASVNNGGILFTTGDHVEGYIGCQWKDAHMLCESEQMKALALYAGEPDRFCSVDATTGEYMLFRGGGWGNGANAGLFCSSLGYPRSHVSTYVGGRSAFFRKR